MFGGIYFGQAYPADIPIYAGPINGPLKQYQSINQPKIVQKRQQVPRTFVYIQPAVVSSLISQWYSPTNQPTRKLRRQQPQYGLNNNLWFPNANILVNGNFEAGSLGSDIQGYYFAPLSINTTTVQEGSQSLQVTTNSSVNSQGAILYSPVARQYQLNQTFYAGIWVWVPTGTSVTFAGRISNHNRTLNFQEPVIKAGIVGNNVWQFVSGVFNLSINKADPAGMNVGIEVYTTTAVSGIVFYLDSAQLYPTGPITPSWTVPTWYSPTNQLTKNNIKKRQQPIYTGSFMSPNGLALPPISQWFKTPIQPTRKLKARLQPTTWVPYIPVIATTILISQWFKTPIQPTRKLKARLQPTTWVPYIPVIATTTISMWVHPVHQPQRRNLRNLRHFQMPSYNRLEYFRVPTIVINFATTAIIIGTLAQSAKANDNTRANIASSGTINTIATSNVAKTEKGEINTSTISDSNTNTKIQGKN